MDALAATDGPDRADTTELASADTTSAATSAATSSDLAGRWLRELGSMMIS
jgi:hypothetical protein